MIFEMISLKQISISSSHSKISVMIVSLYDTIETYNCIDGINITKHLYNKYFNHSNNDLGLIYLTVFQDNFI